NQFMPDVGARCLQTLQAFVRILVIAFNIHPNLRRPTIVRDVDGGHAHQANARISQLAFDQGFDLLAQSLANPPAMVFQPTLLHGFITSGKTDENIRKTGASVCSGSVIVAALAESDKYGGNNMLGRSRRRVWLWRELRGGHLHRRISRNTPRTNRRGRRRGYWRCGWQRAPRSSSGRRGNRASWRC